MAKKKRYSFQDRASYHNSRKDDVNVSESKRIYSRKWVDGYYGSNVDQKYSSVCSEISACKVKMGRSTRAFLYGYRNGLKARMDKDKRTRF